jgi:hypothetical protein
MGGAASRLVRREIDVAVTQVGELLLPEHCEEIVLLGRDLPRALEDVEQRHELVALELLEEAQLANPVLVHHPRDVVRRLLRLVQHRLAVPLELRFRHIEHQLVRDLPDGRERRACDFKRAQVRGVVVQIELVGPRRLYQGLEHLLDESARKRRFGPTGLLGRSRNGRKGHSGKVLS